MDIKDIIKWFIPCFLMCCGNKTLKDVRLISVFVLLLISKSAALDSSSLPKSDTLVSSSLPKSDTLVSSSLPKSDTLDTILFPKSDTFDLKFLIQKSAAEDSTFLISKSDALDSRSLIKKHSSKNDFMQEVTDILDGWTSNVEGVTKMLSEFNRRNDMDVGEYFARNVTGESSEPGGGKLVSKEWSRAPRTFGRPLKKLSMALVPLAFQVGVATTWMFISTLLSLKGVLIGAAILKLLLLAGAAKIGTLFAHHKAEPAHHHQPAWTPQKEVHLHIHNTPQLQQSHSHSYEEHGHPVWSREGGSDNIVLTDTAQFYPANTAGPQTINTPYGSYVRVGPPPPIGGAVRRKRRS